MCMLTRKRVSRGTVAGSMPSERCSTLPTCDLRGWLSHSASHRSAHTPNSSVLRWGSQTAADSNQGQPSNTEAASGMHAGSSMHGPCRGFTFVWGGEDIVAAFYPVEGRGVPQLGLISNCMQKKGLQRRGGHNCHTSMASYNLSCHAACAPAVVKLPG